MRQMNSKQSKLRYCDAIETNSKPSTMRLFLMFPQKTRTIHILRKECMLTQKTCIKIRSCYVPTTQRPQAELRSQQNTGYNDIHLPRIVIPSFSGGYTSWRSYHDLFTAMVHDNQQFSHV